MAKYTSNEQYENDKAALIRIADGISILSFIDNADSIANLLNQSKWIGTNEEADNNNWVTFTSRLDAENFANKLIAEGADNVAIQVLTNRIHSKRGIVYTATFNVCKDFTND